MLGVGAPRRDGKSGDATDWAKREADRSGKEQAELFVPARSDDAQASSAPAASTGWGKRKKL